MTKNEARQRRKIRIRKKISGTAERPRLVIFRSNLHMYAQVVDDLTGAPVKILGEGELSAAIKVEAHKFSQSAADKIRAAGGEVKELEVEG